jgi:hypothetical protein
MVETLVAALAATAIGGGVYAYKKPKGPNPKLPRALKKFKVTSVS